MAESALPVRLYDEYADTNAVNATAGTVSASGTTTIFTPSAGQRSRLLYLCLSSPGDNTTDVTVTVRTGSTDRYKVTLVPGALWARNLMAGRRFVLGALDEVIVLNLSVSQTVHWSLEADSIGG